jgi:hypothetical protein
MVQTVLEVIHTKPDWEKERPVWENVPEKGVQEME